MLHSNRSSAVHHGPSSTRMIMRSKEVILLFRKKASSAFVGSLLLCFFLSSSSTTAFQTGSKNTFFVSDNRLHASTQSYKDAVSDDLTYGIDAPYSEANYDPLAAAKYYKDRPVESLSRLSQIVGKSSGFIFDTLLDAKFNREERVRIKEIIGLYLVLYLISQVSCTSYAHHIISLAGGSTK